MATFDDLPFELLSIIAADSGLANRDRKQARLACGRLAAATTPFIFRRAYISRIKTDRDAFLSLAATPHLAAHVEEIIWFELEIDWREFKETNKLEVQLSDGDRVNLFAAARHVFWLPVEPGLQCEGVEHKIVHRSPPECATKFLVQFKAAVARMPKLHTFASEQMAARRIISLNDGFPFEVGRLMKYHLQGRAVSCSDFLHIFMETIVEEQGRITKLRCANKLSGSLARIDPRHHAALQYLTSLDLSISDAFTMFGHSSMEVLLNAIFQASELRELSISVDCNSEVSRWREPICILGGLIIEPPGKVHRWKHLRSLKLGAIDVAHPSLLPVIKAHATTLRHLHLDQCRPATNFAHELSQIDGLRLDSITISDSDIPKSGLVSEKELLRFICQGDAEDKRQARKIGKGKFVTHNRRPDNIDDEPFEDPDSDHPSDHSSEWWSDTDSDSGL